MRDYVYIWNDPENNFLVASGIEFKDFQNIIQANSGLLFLDHSSEHLQFDKDTGFDFTITPLSNSIWNEDVHSWGSCIWADFNGYVLPSLSDLEVSELLFFKHKARPLNKTEIKNLQNNFLAYSHDDGWFLKLYYSSWDNADILISYIQKTLDVELDTSEFRNSNFALWIEKHKIERLEKTLDIDSILSRMINSKKKTMRKKSMFSRIFRKREIA